ncbi:hypothetical protein ADK67_21475 [Saccharothrix sp. NRRL B-16348]|uniref:hypothetical protein n=1 Tax=Saccharothrix sp. NRRL B-16348 TaxID=1415542 RepID=UPI0006AFB269|nr:hypothetical protein [Saccharothrix sp. NRRL B-16348]KOX23202.1 hypothetical protein ADK67_21475 [Saccharothrix sp. NRRL B-16348]
MSLTPIYDDLLREFEGIILVSEAAEAVQAAVPTADQPAAQTAEPAEDRTTVQAAAPAAERVDEPTPDEN